MSPAVGMYNRVKSKVGPRTCVYRAFAGYIVVLHSGHSPGEAEWAAMVDTFRELDLTALKVLVFTYGGAPNARQRATLNDVLRAGAPPIAIMTPSALARAVGTAMTWFNPRMALFGPDQLSEAMTHLGSPEHDTPRLKLVLAELERELQRLSGSSPRSGSLMGG